VNNLVNVIAIDGPAASGKSTIASCIAEALNITYVNTGNMYRAVTLFAMQRGFTTGSTTAEKTVIEALSAMKLDYVRSEDGSLPLELNGVSVNQAIRTPEVSENVSFVAAIPAVRNWLIEKQRQFAKLGMIVMEGRDIGTVVFPNAKYKFFLTASPEVRAKRRLEQEGESLEGATVASVAKEIAKRDEMDTNRKIAPLKQAEDAILIDTSDMTIDEIVKLISKQISASGI
jgi:CMP/dCMP kinase